MLLDKQSVIRLIEDDGASAGFLRAARSELPEQIDHEQHANLLRRFGLDPQEVLLRIWGNTVVGR